MFFDQLTSKLSARVDENGVKIFEIDENILHLILRAAAHSIKFDERYYLDRYPDVADAVRAGSVPSAHDHFVEHGYFENRIPFAIDVDERFYAEQYQDVMQAMKAGDVSSGRAHFEAMGRKEGRLPSAHFSYYCSRPSETRQKPVRPQLKVARVSTSAAGRFDMADRLYGAASRSA